MVVLFLEAVYYFLMILSILIIANALLSWFPTPALRQVKGIIGNLIDPILNPIRKMIQRSIFGGSHMSIDFSPFIAYLIITTLQRYIAVFMGGQW